MDKRYIWALLGALGLTACGDEDATAGKPAAKAGVITQRADLAEGTIQIVARGTFVQPGDFASAELFGAGSGFIIDSSGLAVTNNHVVTGAGALQVFIGERPEPINARLLGASECNDLAVIDLSGDGYRYFDWYEGNLNRGLPVLAAGYPLGDPLLTETEGILSKTETEGQTPWAAVEKVLEHTARIRGGNSGGPLLSVDNLRVLGVNFAGSDETDQNLAISENLVRPLIEELSNGDSVESLGINGQAIATTDGSVTGIWVVSVEPGSAADEVGLKPGDVITDVGGVSPAADGTLRGYCDVLRTRGSDAVLSVTALRITTGEVLEGPFNGTGRLISNIVSPNLPAPSAPPAAPAAPAAPPPPPPVTPPPVTPPPVAPPPPVTPPPVTPPPPVTSSSAGAEWINYRETQSGTVCDVINGSDFEAVLLPTGQLLLVRDTDRVLMGVSVNENDEVVRTSDGAVLGNVLFDRTSNGQLSLWALFDDGTAMALEDDGLGLTAADFTSAPCNNGCALVDNPAPGMCP
jgi:S1-C subfamily serine protease